MYTTYHNGITYTVGYNPTAEHYIVSSLPEEDADLHFPHCHGLFATRREARQMVEKLAGTTDLVWR